MSMRLGSGAVAAVLAGLALVAVGVALASTTLIAFGPGVAVVGALEAGRRHRVKVDRRRSAHLVELIDDIVLELRSGRTLSAALATTVEASSTQAAEGGLYTWFAPIRAVGPRGLTVRAAAQALQADSETTADDRLRLVAATLCALTVQGGPAVPALRRLRFALAGIGQAVEEAETQAGQARASSAMMVAAPFVFAIALGAADRSARQLYLYSTNGLICLVAAGALSYSGWRWMAFALDRSVRSQPASTSRRWRRAGGGTTSRRLRPGRQPDRRGLVIELVSMVLAGGGTVQEAVAFVADSGPTPDRDTFRYVLDRAANGELLVDALPAVSEQLGSSYRSMVATLTLCDQGGAAISLTLRQLSDEADAARRRELELRSKRLSVSLLVPLLVCSLPALVIGAVVPLIIVALSHLNA